MAQSVQQISVEEEPLNNHFEPLIVPCRHSHSSYRFLNSFIQWLVCWPDPYQTSNLSLIWIIWGIVAIILDMGTDLWVAKTHYSDGHYAWTYLTIIFVFLPMVFAFGYIVLLRRSQHWYEVHPIGQFYWSFKMIQAYKQRTKYRFIETPDDAASFVHYTHEISRNNTRYCFASAYESYFESFPECILQAYFIARLWSNAHHQDQLNQITWNMWLSVGVSAISLVGCESTVTYNLNFASTVLEPSICDAAFRIVLDLMCVLPRLAAIACFFTIEHKNIAIPNFIIFHVIIIYLWFGFSKESTESACKQYRGYKEHHSRLMNQLRAIVVSFLFPPTYSWHLHDVAQDLSTERTPSNSRQTKNSLQRQFWVVSVFQFVESGVLFGLWSYFKSAYGHTGEFHQILIPTISLTLLLIRPYCDVLCQMWILKPIAKFEAANCIRFRGEVAKTRTLEVGSDIVNIITDLLHRLHYVKLLFRQPITDENRVMEECHLIASDFELDKLIRRYREKRTNIPTLKMDKVAVSPGPETENLFNEIDQQDSELLQNVVSLARQCKLLSEPDDVFVKKLQGLVKRCEDRVELWKKVFVSCLNHQLLPENFYEYHQKDNQARRSGNTKYADYMELIRLNKEAGSLANVSSCRRCYCV